MTSITVIKYDHTGVEKMRYPGKVLTRENSRLDIEAKFQGEDIDVHDIAFRVGDRFLETYYTKRWYNIYEIYDRADDHLKGWYCNICHPAIIEDGQVSFRDLALDLLVYPDGRQLVLDEDEFKAANLEITVANKARSGLKELQEIFSNNQWGNNKKFQPPN
ncbi:MAG: DUF402 domain-containing protein [Chloroflexota bacterium]